MKKLVITVTKIEDKSGGHIIRIQSKGDESLKKHLISDVLRDISLMVDSHDEPWFKIKDWLKKFLG